MDVPHFVYSSVDGHLGCLLLLVLLRAFAYKFLLKCLFSILSCINLGVELLDYMVNLCLRFWVVFFCSVFCTGD
jgi:hypothetical protein